MLNLYKKCLLKLKEKGLLIAVSNNRGDQLYTKLGCGIETQYIPSLCAYTSIKYLPIRESFLCYSGSLPSHSLITKREDIGRFKWSSLGEFKGIIHIPYEVSTMSMFEHYTAGIPLFFPSKTYMEKYEKLQSVYAYWNLKVPAELSVISWIELSDFYNLFNKSPNVYFFESFHHLIELLETFKWKEDEKILTDHKDMIQKKWHEVISGYFPIK